MIGQLQKEKWIIGDFHLRLKKLRKLSADKIITISKHWLIYFFYSYLKTLMASYEIWLNCQELL